METKSNICTKMLTFEFWCLTPKLTICHLRSATHPENQASPPGGCERISFAAASANDRALAYPYPPNQAKPPGQTILHGHPGMELHFDCPQPGKQFWLDFIIMGRRAFLLPVLERQYQRRYATGSVKLPDILSSMPSGPSRALCQCPSAPPRYETL